LYNKTYISREIHLKQRPSGFVTENDFELVQVNIPQLKEDEFLVRNIWMSVDPHMRIFMGSEIGARPAFQLNKIIDGGCVGQVVESRSDKFNVGDYVLGNSGWREYWISNDDDSRNNNNNITKIDPTIAPIQYFLGILGITGFTAYLGLFKIGELKEGADTVLFQQPLVE
jgi:NADPH-dependent curcumin reductase CurA